MQTVLCDALAVQAVPVPASDIPRWVSAESETTVTLRSADRSWRVVLIAPDANHLKLVSERGFVELERER